MELTPDADGATGGYRLYVSCLTDESGNIFCADGQCDVIVSRVPMNLDEVNVIGTRTECRIQVHDWHARARWITVRYRSAPMVEPF